MLELSLGLEIKRHWNGYVKPRSCEEKPWNRDYQKKYTSKSLLPKVCFFTAFVYTE